MIALGLLAALGYLAWVRPPGERRRGSVAVTVAIAAIAIAPAPYVTWRIVEDVRYTSGLSSWIAARYGVSVVQVHPAIFDAAAAHMPRTARYYLKVSPTVDSTRRQAFEQWAAGWLLPRVAVSSPGQAEWILTLGVDPSTVGPPLSRKWRIWPAVEGTPSAYLGKVRT